MSDELKILESCDHSGRYTVKELHGCRMVFGDVPISEFKSLSKGYSTRAIVAVDIADLIGATLVIGEPDDIRHLHTIDLPISQARQKDSLTAQQLGLHAVAAWLLIGKRGVSSNAMCRRIFGVPQQPTGFGSCHPRDPDDLNRCLLFLDSTNSRDKLHLMNDVSPEWARLVGRC